MHLTDDEALLWHLEFVQAGDERADHVAACESCSSLVSETSDLISQLREPETWRIPSERSSWRASLANLESLQERLETEEADAHATIARSRPSDLEERATTHPTVGLVRALTTASFQSVERDPSRGALLARLGVEAASRLRESDYPPDVVAMTRGLAWRQQANALRMLGTFTEALEALDRGATEFSRTRVPAPELASLDYIRAAILYTQGNLPAAGQLLEAAIDIFRSFGDETRWRNAQLLLSGLYERQGDFERAAGILHELLRLNPPEDIAFRGRILLSLGVSMLHTDSGRAESYLQQARHCLRRAGLPTEALRAEWNLGRAASLVGDDERALTQLAEAYETAETLGLMVDVAMIALDRAELLLRAGEPEAVATLCSEALRTFDREGATRFKAEAFAYLEKSARARTISFVDLQHVRGYIEDTVARAVDAPFAPPLTH